MGSAALEIWQFLKKLNIHRPWDPVILSLHKRNKNWHSHKDLSPNVLNSFMCNTVAVPHPDPCICRRYFPRLHWMPETVQFSSVAQLCPTLCDPMNRSTPGLPVHHQLPESTQTHVHQVSDTIQPSHPLSSPSPALNLSQHHGLFKWVSSSHQVAKVSEFQLQHQSFQWTTSVESSLTSRVSKSAIQQENEKWDTRIQRKARIRGPTPLQGEGAETESKPALLYFQLWMKE